LNHLTSLEKEIKRYQLSSILLVESAVGYNNTTIKNMARIKNLQPFKKRKQTSQF